MHVMLSVGQPRQCWVNGQRKRRISPVGTVESSPLPRVFNRPSGTPTADPSHAVPALPWSAWRRAGLFSIVPRGHNRKRPAVFKGRPMNGPRQFQRYWDKVGQAVAESRQGSKTKGRFAGGQDSLPTSHRAAARGCRSDLLCMTARHGCRCRRIYGRRRRGCRRGTDWPPPQPTVSCVSYTPSNGHQSTFDLPLIAFQTGA
jgi:hypothetical protein